MGEERWVRWDEGTEFSCVFAPNDERCGVAADRVEEVDASGDREL
ncbi:MAG TPA: hypothetical protein V6C97_07770 [Oculatellaceae cyanobacterium]